MLSLSFRCLYSCLYLRLIGFVVVGVVLMRSLVLVLAVAVAVVPVLVAVVVPVPHGRIGTYPPPTHRQTHETDNTTTTETASIAAARVAEMQMLVDKMVCRA